MIDIPEVPVTIVFGEGVGGMGRGVVQVWEDASGRIRFMALPEQRPFFAAMKYDQLRAQAEGIGANKNGPDRSGPLVTIAPNGAWISYLCFFGAAFFFAGAFLLVAFFID